MGMKMLSAVVLLQFALALASPNCNTFTDCGSCTGAQTWMPGSNCRWCTKDQNCHAELSIYDPCSHDEIIWKPSDCPATPTPAPTPAPVIENPYAADVVKALLKALGVTDVDASVCVHDVAGVDVKFVDFGKDVAAKQYSLALTDLSDGLSALSTSVNDCHLTEIQTKIDALAKSIKWANISTSAIDESVKILVGASDLWTDLKAVASAIENKDTTAIGTSLSTLLADWTSITGGCTSSEKVCNFMDGLLKMVAVVAKEITPCENALEPAIATFETAAADFQAKNYTGAVEAVARGLDTVSLAVAADSCGLKTVADQLALVVPKLKSAIVRVESSSAVSIIVGSADVYDEIYQAVLDLDKGDYAGFGFQMGALLAEVKASGCATKACIVVEGILNSLEIAGEDFATCSADLDAAWTHLEDSITDLKAKQWSNSVVQIGDFFVAIAKSVSGCGVPQLGTVLEDVAAKLAPGGNVTTVIGDVVQVLVSGADLTLDLQELAADASAKRWSSVGADLGNLASFMKGTHCNTMVCKIVEGMLQGAGIAFDDLVACEADLRSAEVAFTAGAHDWDQGQIGGAVRYWASGLNTVAKSAKDCGLEAELSFIEQEANVLGFGNVTMISDAASIIVHGTDFYELLYSTFIAFGNHDYRSAGSDLIQVMNQLSEWTNGHACQSDFCYVVIGAAQFLGDIQGSVKSCESDFRTAFTNFTDAYKHIVDTTQPGIHFQKDPKQIKAGVGEIGEGFQLIASGVSDCHVAQLADLLSKLAVKLGVVPEVGWVEEVLHILIESVHVEQDIGNACQDWSVNNYVGFGYNIAKLIEVLV